MKFGPTNQSRNGSSRLQAAARRSKNPRVVLVDDSKTMLDVLRIHLTGLGLELVCIDNPAQALVEARWEVPDLIVTDVNMPGMNGIEFCRLLRASGATANVPVIIVSSRLTEDVRAKATELGVRVCLQKPVQPHLLQAAVTQVVGAR